ncbi:MAG: hypothetical protein II904_00715 [Oscillospiraceae bacterium]|nr:hypothetical protein [Oscillospiraceae bacterium]
MFGYVRAADEMLSQEDRQRYQSVYCGLCHALGRRYGLAGRMILNFDLTFLAMLLQEGPCDTCEKRCIAHPFKARTCQRGSGALDTAADMSVILTWWQVQDGIADHGFLGALQYRFAALLLGWAYRRAKGYQPDFDAATQRQLRDLAEMERRGEPSLDAPADAFARLLAAAAEGARDPVKHRVLGQMLYHLGRWIYLVDAADDLPKDAKSGSYNPLPRRYHLPEGKLTDEARRDLSMTLDSSVRAMAAAFELWDFGENRGIIENIVYQGLYAVGGAVLNGTYRRRIRRKGGHAHA